MRKLVFLLFPILFFGCTPQQVNDTLNAVLGETSGLSSDQIGNGLKEALRIGAQAGANELSAPGGYFDDLAYRILLPDEVRKVTDRLQNVPGFANLEATILKKINQGAEDAATKAAPIFVGAIRQMTIQDALGLLKGDRNAATKYLRGATSQSLYNEFSPVIATSLDKFDAQKVWEDAARAYNNFPLTRQPVNTNLADHVTQKALEGLFHKVALKEEDIRQNIGSRTSELLRKVFALQDGE